MKNILSALALCVALAGCAATGQGYSPQALTAPAKGKAQLIIYRPSSLVGIAESPTISINGKDTCDLSSGSFFVTSASAGNIKIVSSEYGGRVKSSLSLKVHAGTRYFIKVSANAGKALAGGFGAVGAGAYEATAEDTGVYQIRPIDKDVAGEEIAGTKQSMDCK